MKAGYEQFRVTAFELFGKELQHQNALDVALYRVVVRNLCHSLHEYNLWENVEVRQYWRTHTPLKIDECA